MTSLEPSEEERRLLRMYRLVAIPPRRSSCSPATSNASSSTTATITNPIDHQMQPHLIAVPKGITPNSSPTTDSDNDQQQSNLSVSKCLNEQTNNNISVDEQAKPLSQPRDKAYHNQPIKREKQSHCHHHHHHSHHHHSHHHGASHKAKHKHSLDQTSDAALSTDEVNQMLELVSSLNYLRLVTPNGKAAKLATDELEVGHLDSSEDHDSHDVMLKTKNLQSNKRFNQKESSCHTTTTLTNSHRGNIMSPGIQNRHISLIDKTSCSPYIFEKVDYIKKISIRRKAFKKMKKAGKVRSQSAASPGVTESSKIRL